MNETVEEIKIRTIKKLEQELQQAQETLIYLMEWYDL
jgi:hypothetical protein